MPMSFLKRQNFFRISCGADAGFLLRDRDFGIFLRVAVRTDRVRAADLDRGGR